MASDPANDFRSGDLDNNVLRKILNRLLTLIGAVETVTPVIVLDPGDVQIGAVMLKDGVGAALTAVQTTVPTGAEPAVVTRNIPSGTQTVAGTVAVSNLPATQPVSGTVAVSNLPATQPVSGTVAVSNFPASQVVSNPLDIANPIFDAAHQGTINGKVARSFHILGRRAGFNSTSILQDVGEFIGTGIDAFPELTGAESLEVVSSNANDTAAGTGARTVRVTYLDTSNNLVTSADITLNGVTPVAVAWKANFIISMETTTVGTNAVAVGNVVLRIAGGGATQEQITAGGNKSLAARFMIPAGYTGYLTEWQANAVGNTTQDVRLRATVRSGDRSLGTAYIFQDNQYVSSTSGVDSTLPYLVCPALTKIKVSTLSGATASTNRLDSDFTILLIAN